jgi:phenylpyruvate tautomerase PptA (4-oxalocrotonate tautomerase family)
VTPRSIEGDVAMPLVRIDLAAGQSADTRRAVTEVIYAAMIEALNVPKDDRFMIVSEHAVADLVVDPGYLGIKRTKDAIVIQATLNEGRTVDQKRAFYKAVADGLHQRIGLRREDVFINLVEVKKENWSFGDGEAQYAK